MTLPVGLANLASKLSTNYPMVFAGMTLASVPMIVFFFAAQCFFVRIFDCDGVLVDSETVSAGVSQRVLADLGVTVPLEEILDRFAGASPEVFAAALVSPRLAEQLAALRRQRTRSPSRSRSRSSRSSTRTLFSRSDEHARSRRQGRSPAPHRSHHQDVPHLRAPHRLRRPRTYYEAIRDLDPRRVSVKAREQDLETDHVPLRIRRTPRPRIARLLRSKDRPGQTSQPSPHRPRKTSIRRALRDAPRRHPPPIASRTDRGIGHDPLASPGNCLSIRYDPAESLTEVLSALGADPRVFVIRRHSSLVEGSMAFDVVRDLCPAEITEASISRQPPIWNLRRR